MKEEKVKIKKCDEPLSWYKELIGEEFSVYYDAPRYQYILKEDYDRGYNAVWHHILAEDVEVIISG